MKTTFFTALLFLVNILYAQTGTIRGTVIDKQSELPLVGANIELLNSNDLKGTTTDIDGNFTIENIPLGRQVIRIRYIGYESVTLPNIEITAGKDAVVNTSLIEAFDKLDEVIITNTNAKAKAINKMAAVSARQFGLEEVTRFSGGRSDVGRLAANFAGVSAPDDSRNDIVVRGNSPVGLLWRLEGIPIPSPNHYSTLGTTGGPVSALNPNLLKNSDFITSAFPAEYGNAIGGVFDLGFRKGNTEDYEFTGQVGAFTGVEAMAEGPLGKNKGSFLVAGRYSLVGLLGVGAGGTSAVPNYKDVSFNIDFGKSKLGNFSLFGIIGDSDIDFFADSIDEDDLFAADDENTLVNSGFGVVGLKHNLNIGKKSFLRTIVSASDSSNDFLVERFINKDTPQERIIKYTEGDSSESRVTFSTLFNSKFSSKATLRTGVLVENFTVKSLFESRQDQPDRNGDGDPDLFSYMDTEDNMTIAQPYIQSQFRPFKNLTFNTGLHSQYSTLNKQFVIEPRASISYKIASQHTLSFGYGLHHQPISLPILLLNQEINGNLEKTNIDLDFVRSSHYVFGYDVRIANNWRGKIELYYQNIDKAAVEPFPSSYSSLTEGADFGFELDRVSLVNNGTGFNRGIEFTLEKFFSEGYYSLFTASIFESKYKGSDGIERNTPFNNGYVFNALGGKEFKVGKLKKNVLFFDARISFAGGRFFTPVDLEASNDSGFEVLKEDQAFSEQIKDYFRWDFKFGYKINSKTKKLSQQFYVDLQNVTNNDNVFVQRYNRLTNEINTVNQIGFFPDVGYKIQF